MSTRRHPLDLTGRHPRVLPDLSPLDPADTSGDRADSPAARQMLATILATDPATSTSSAASTTPAGALAQRPVWKQPRARRIALAATSAAAVVVTSAVMLTADPTAPASYASWSAVPASPTTAQADLQTSAGEAIPAQASKCTAIADAAVGIEGVPERAAEAAQRSVLVDRRGDWTYCVDITKGSGTASDPLIALSGLIGGDASQGVTATVWDKPYTWPTGSDVDVLGGRPYAIADEGDPTRINYSLNGSLGPEVAGVDINLADGTTVTSTVHDDFWAAWWPGRASTARVDTLTVHTTTGTSYDIDPRTIQLPWAQYGASTSIWP